MNSVLFAEMASTFTEGMRVYLDTFERELDAIEADLGDVSAHERARDAAWSMKDAAAELAVNAEEEDIARRLKAVSTLARMVEVRLAEAIRESRPLDPVLVERMRRAIPTIYAVLDSNLNFGGDAIPRIIEDLHTSHNADSTQGDHQTLTQDDLDALFDADVRARAFDNAIEPPPTEPPELPLRRDRRKYTESRSGSDAVDRSYGDPILDAIALIIGERTEESSEVGDSSDEADELSDLIDLEVASEKGDAADSSTIVDTPSEDKAPIGNQSDENTALRGVFIGEARKTLDDLGSEIIALERDAHDAPTVNTALRLAHTLKGSAAMLGYERIRTLSHAMEGALQAVRDHGAVLTTEIIDVLLDSLDELGRLVDAIEDRGVEEPRDGNIDERIQQLLTFANESFSQSDALHREPAEPVTIVNVSDSTELPETEGREEYAVIGQVDTSDVLPEDFPRWSYAVQTELVRASVALDIDASNIGARHQFSSAAKRLAHGADLSGFDKIAALASELCGVIDGVTDQGSLARSILDALAAGTETLERTLFRVRRDGLDRDPACDDVVSLLASIRTKESLTVSSDQATGTESRRDDRRGRSRTVEVDLDRLNRLLSLAAELVTSRNRLSTELDRLADTVAPHEAQYNPSESLSRIGVIAKDLHDEILGVRMVRVENAFDRLPRILRDAARSANKKVNLVLEGADTEIDRNILEAMNNPLLHLIRNTVGHGVETPEERIAVGKSATGEVRVRAEQDGNRIIVEVSDDGRGIDPERIRAIAVEREFLTSEQALSLTDKETIDLIFRPGFTTVETVNELSGRGVGLDVVRSVATRFNGSVTVESVGGRGTTFRVTLPLTLAIGQALLVEVCRSIFALPIPLVERIVHASNGDIENRNGTLLYLDGDRHVPIVALGEILRLREGDGRAYRESETLVLAKEGDLVGALVVDRVIGRQDIVIKTLGRHLRRVRGISGATVLGDGSIALILNVHDLLISESGEPPSANKSDGANTAAKSVASAGRRHSVLVVDDSVTMRKYLSDVLTRAGFEVRTASDGSEGLHALGDRRIDIVITDLEMPSMGGYELVAEMMRRDRTATIPVVLLTARSDANVRETAVELGVAECLTKPFDEARLLHIVSNLVTR